MSRFLIFAVLLPAMVFAIQHENCDVGNSPIAVRVPGCDATPCVFPPSYVISFEVDFHAQEDSSELTLQVNANFLGEDHVIEIPAPLYNACLTLLNAACPIAAGQLVSYSGSIPLESQLHGGVPVRMQAILINPATQTRHMCFEANSIIS